MAKIYKLTKGGQTIYPATTTDAVVHPTTRKNLTEELAELNERILDETKRAQAAEEVNALSKHWQMSWKPWVHVDSQE